MAEKADSSSAAQACAPSCESFEGAVAPPYWQVRGPGACELSHAHSKDGDRSLCWSWSATSTLSCAGYDICTQAHPQAGMRGWVYCEQPLQGCLGFRMGSSQGLRAGRPAFAFDFRLGFTGWRAFQIQFETDARASAGGNPLTAVETIEIVSPGGRGKVFLDSIEVRQVMDWNRSADYQVPGHAGGPGQYWQHWPLRYMRSEPRIPEPDSVREEQLAAFAAISKRYRKWLLGEAPDASGPLLAAGAEQMADYIALGWRTFADLDLKVAADGWITGPGLRLRKGPNTFHTVFYNALFPLVLDYRLHGSDKARDGAFLLFDYVQDQGWAEGSALGSLILNCLVFAPFCHSLALMAPELRETGRFEKLWRAALWYLSFGKSFSDFDGAFIETNADELRSTILTSLVTVLAMEDAPRKVQLMQGWLAWFDSALEITPRFAGVFKPDGLGWHHRGVYAGAYATEAYEFGALIAWLLHGTCFAASPRGAANLKRALLTQNAISNKYDVPYATMGRMPRPGVRIFSAYAYLALASEPVDRELAGIFMRLWHPGPGRSGQGDARTNYLLPALKVDLDGQNGKFLCLHTLGRLQLMQELADRGLPAAPAPEGFFACNWGALAVHRRGEWAVSVKGFSQYVWDFEMHPRNWAAVEENVFARYWSYGTLQPVTHGEPINPVDSGWALDRGWDWTRWPGATTPHLSLEELYDPQSSWACRFFSSATMVGGVSSGGRNGVFALKLHEHFYDPGFRALKTYFFFDNEIVCLGSNIETRDAAHATETTLFQSWMPDPRMPIQVNGERVTDERYKLEAAPERPVTLLDPYGNGYVVVEGRRLALRRGEQVSRDAWNRGETRGAFSTAWIDHGHGPRDLGHGEETYEYVMLVQTDPASLAAYAAERPYRVLQRDHRGHILEHPAHRCMGYVLFETDWAIPHGPIRKTDTPVLAVVKELDEGIRLSVVDPDLRLPKRRNIGYLDDEAERTESREHTVTLELRGRWRISAGPPSASVAAMGADTTRLRFTCRNGATIEADLVRQPEADPKAVE